MAAARTSWTRSFDASTYPQWCSGALPTGMERSAREMKRDRSFAGESIPTNVPSAARTGSEDSPDFSSSRNASTSGIPASIIGTSGSTSSLTRT